MPRLLRFIIRNGADTPFTRGLGVAARVVAAGQLLDLDHVGAEVGEHHAGRRARHDLREFEHAHAGQRPGGALATASCLHAPCRRSLRQEGDPRLTGRHGNSGLFLARNAA